MHASRRHDRRLISGSHSRPFSVQQDGPPTTSYFLRRATHPHRGRRWPELLTELVETHRFQPPKAPRPDDTLQDESAHVSRLNHASLLSNVGVWFSRRALQCLKCRRPVRDHRHPVLVGGGNHLLVADRPAGVNHRRGALARATASTPSRGNGKKASDAATDPVSDYRPALSAPPRAPHRRGSSARRRSRASDPPS